MKKLIVIFVLVVGVVQADANYVLYNADNGMVYSYDKQMTAKGWIISNDGTFQSPPQMGATKRVLFTTNALPVANISQLTDKTLVDPLDLLNDYTQWTDRERKMMSLIRKEINILRIKAGLAERTPLQMIRSLKDE